ncbi:MAG TPA: DUF4386 domain-containing protein [Anaerolineaceae bacterium]|nr:DUF4386 domain-containing protein [Anaerolineaceae bacterium]
MHFLSFFLYERFKVVWQGKLNNDNLNSTACGDHFAALILLSGASYLQVFSTAQIIALVMLFLDLHNYGYSIVDIFFGLWLFPLGYLVFKSGYFPKILGVLLMIACFGYLIQFFTTFLFPAYQALATPGLAVVTLAELAFALWLLIKGAKLPETQLI